MYDKNQLTGIILTVLVGSRIVHDNIKTTGQAVLNFFEFYKDFNWKTAIAIDGPGENVKMPTIMSIVEPRNNMTAMSFKQAAAITMKIRADYEKLQNMNSSNLAQITKEIFEVSKFARTLFTHTRNILGPSGAPHSTVNSFTSFIHIRNILRATLEPLWD